MRYAIGIVLSVALALDGCSSGQETGGVVFDRTPTEAELKNAIVSFDFLGPLWVSTAELPLTLPNLSACPGSDGKYPFTSCIESVTLDGAPADAADLKMGQVVEIHGARFSWIYGGTPPALSPDNPSVTIDIQRAVVGPIETVDVERAWMTVLGQRVYVDSAIVASAAIGDNVAVYGHFTITGQIVAELVEPYDGEPLFLVRGVLTETTPGHFAIGELEVDLASATRENFPAGAPIPGDTVLVFGAQPPTAGVLSAATVRCIGACSSARWESGSLRGFITGWRSPTDFDIDGTAVRPSSCECGYAPPVAPGTFVDVQVTDGNAQITQASSTSRTIGLAGQITAIDPTQGDILVLGYRVHVSPATHITADPDAYFEALAFDSLTVGDAVEISGQPHGAGIRADTIVRQGDANIVKVLDYTLAEPAIEAAGRTILTQDATRVDLCDGDGAMMGLGWLFGTAWSDLDTWLVVEVDPNSEPLIAERVIVCPPNYAEPGFDLYW